MRKGINLILLSVLSLICTHAYSQTFDYAYRTFTTSCNFFATAATIGNCEHLTSLSRPSYDDNSVILKCKTNGTNSVLATIYSIKYSFKAGFRYKISVNYKGVKDVSDGYFPNIGLKISNDNGGIDAGTDCIDPSAYALSSSATFVQGASGSSYAWANNLIDVTASQNSDYLLVGAFLMQVQLN